ncbi:MAG: hypothetical protein MUO77_08990 [Anaerolineales bacterium]|nr:hypothetical protein [Anaerolineales bacterium]
MSRKQQLIFMGCVIIISILACQSSTSPIPDSEGEPTKPGEILTPVVVTEDRLLSIPPNFLADPNTACAIHLWEGAISCLDGDGWHIYEDDDFENPRYAPTVISQCPDGRIYLIGPGFYRLEGGSLVKIDSEGTNAGGFFSTPSEDAFACGPGDEIWVGYMDGVSHFDGSTWTDYPVTEYLGVSGGGTGIRSITVAPNGSVWVVVYNNIATFDGTNWQIIKTDGAYGSLAVDANGNVWVSDGRSLLKYDNVQWSIYPYPEDLGQVGHITLDEENRVWVASYQGTAYTFDPQTNSWALQFDEYAFTKYAFRGRVEQMHFDRQGRLWVATYYGLYIYDGSVWTVYHMHTADLYSNIIDEIVIFGDGPTLPALEPKAPGWVHGRLVNSDSTTYANMQVEICLETVQYDFSGDTPCAYQNYHALTTVGTDGNFVFNEIPVGNYYLMIQVSAYTWKGIGEFKVNTGERTELGEIVFPP